MIFRPYFLEPVSVTLSGKEPLSIWLNKGYWDGTLSWTVMVDPKCSHMCLYKREAEEALMTEEDSMMWGLKAEVGVICPGDRRSHQFVVVCHSCVREKIKCCVYLIVFENLAWVTPHQLGYWISLSTVLLGRASTLGIIRHDLLVSNLWATVPAAGQ